MKTKRTNTHEATNDKKKKKKKKNGGVQKRRERRRRNQCQFYYIRNRSDEAKKRKILSTHSINASLKRKQKPKAKQNETKKEKVNCQSLSSNTRRSVSRKIEKMQQIHYVQFPSLENVWTLMF